jgi:hypothetical protein
VTAQLAALHPSVSAKSVGMPGYGVDQIWLATRHDAIPMDPDLLVVLIYPEDFDRSFSAFRPTEGFVKPSFRVRDGQLVERTPDDCETWLTRFLAENSRIFALYREPRYVWRDPSGSGVGSL